MLRVAPFTFLQFARIIMCTPTAPVSDTYADVSALIGQKPALIELLDIIVIIIIIIIIIIINIIIIIIHRHRLIGGVKRHVHRRHPHHHTSVVNDTLTSVSSS